MIDTFFIHPVDELAKLRIISTAFTAHKMATEDLLMKVDKLVGEFNEIVKEERAKMMVGVQAYKAEKERMEAFVVSDDDIIDLKVGGKKLNTTRSTLCQVEGSFLASMFSGRWEDGLKRDKDGAVFFDFNPQHFALILDYLIFVFYFVFVLVTVLFLFALFFDYLRIFQYFTHAKSSWNTPIPFWE